MVKSIQGGKKAAPSNKHAKVSIGTDQVSNLITPLKFKPAIDMVSVTLGSNDPYERQHITNAIDDMLKLVVPGKAIEDQPHNYSPGARAPYKRAITIHPILPGGGPARHGILVQVDPWYVSQGFMRFAWNPSRLHLAGFNYIKNYEMPQMMNKWHERLISEGRATRIDIAVDLLRLHIDDIIIRVKQMRATGLFTGADGKTETLYFGKNKNNQVTAYDLVRRAKVKKFPIPKGPRTRIEWRYRKGISVSELGKLPTHPEHGDIWKRVVVHQPDPTTFPGGIGGFELFRNACQTRGVNRALAMVPPDQRPEYEKAMNASIATWWKPSTIWEWWPRALKIAALTLPDGQSAKSIKGMPKALD